MIWEGTALNLDVANDYDIVLWSTEKNSSTITITAAGTYTVNGGVGVCAAVDATFNVVVLPDELREETVPQCENQEVVIDGVVHDTPGTYELSYLSTQGCDSIVILTILPDNCDDCAMHIKQGRATTIQVQRMGPSLHDAVITTDSYSKSYEDSTFEVLLRHVHTAKADQRRSTQPSHGDLAQWIERLPVGACMTLME